MIKTLELTDYLPIYNSQGELIQKKNKCALDSVSQTNDSKNDDGISDWVKKAARKGRIGELEVKKFIEDVFSVKVLEMVDSAGYDLCVINEDINYCVEVKTSNSKHFYISRNEIEVSKYKQNHYFIFFVEAEGTGEMTKCKRLFVLQNPYKELNLERILENDVTLNNINLNIQTIEIQFEDFDGFNEIEAFAEFIEK